jgi:hypothetical protein
MVIEVRDIASQLVNIRFTDIAPRDLEAVEHARQHLQAGETDFEINEEMAEKRKMEGLEDMLSQLTAGSNRGQFESGRPTIEDIRLLKTRLEVLTQRLGLSFGLG